MAADHLSVADGAGPPARPRVAPPPAAPARGGATGVAKSQQHALPPPDVASHLRPHSVDRLTQPQLFHNDKVLFVERQGLWLLLKSVGYGSAMHQAPQPCRRLHSDQTSLCEPALQRAAARASPNFLWTLCMHCFCTASGRS